MSTVTVYYQKCPKCGQTWSAQLSQARVIRIGKEVFVCRCGTEWPTGRIEWVRLNQAQRRAYFVSTAEIGVLVICTLSPALFGYFIGDGWRSALKAAGWGLLVGAGFVLVLWGIKLCIVGVSKFRTRHIVPKLSQVQWTPAPENAEIENPPSPDEGFAGTLHAAPTALSASQARRLKTGAIGFMGSHVLFFLSVIGGFLVAMNTAQYMFIGT